MVIEKSGIANQEYMLRKICKENNITDPIVIRAEMAKLGLDFHHGGTTGINKSAAKYNGGGIDEYLGYMTDQGAMLVRR
jgi:hypothetical protein